MEQWLELYNTMVSYFGQVINDYWRLFTGFGYGWILFPFTVTIIVSLITIVLHYFAKGLSDV